VRFSPFQARVREREHHISGGLILGREEREHSVRRIGEKTVLTVPPALHELFCAEMPDNTLGPVREHECRGREAMQRECAISTRDPLGALHEQRLELIGLNCRF
jgi:hypothetical protein